MHHWYDNRIYIQILHRENSTKKLIYNKISNMWRKCQHLLYLFIRLYFAKLLLSLGLIIVVGLINPTKNPNCTPTKSNYRYSRRAQYVFNQFESCFIPLVKYRKVKRGWGEGAEKNCKHKVCTLRNSDETAQSYIIM